LQSIPNPTPIGIIAVATAGTPVSAGVNLNSFYGDPLTGHSDLMSNLYFYRLDITASTSNTGNTYLVITNPAYVGTKWSSATGKGLVATLGPGASYTLIDPVGRDIWYIGDFGFDADTNGNSVVAVVQRG